MRQSQIEELRYHDCCRNMSSTLIRIIFSIVLLTGYEEFSDFHAPLKGY